MEYLNKLSWEEKDKIMLDSALIVKYVSSKWPKMILLEKLMI